MKGQGKICFGLLEILARYLVNRSQEVFVRLVCPPMIFLPFIPPHNLIKEKLLDLIERDFKQFYKNEGSPYLACNDKKACFTSTDQRGYKLWSCQNVCDALSYLLDNIYIRFGKKL